MNVTGKTDRLSQSVLLAYLGLSSLEGFALAAYLLVFPIEIGYPVSLTQITVVSLLSIAGLIFLAVGLWFVFHRKKLNRFLAWLSSDHVWCWLLLLLFFMLIIGFLLFFYLPALFPVLELYWLWVSFLFLYLVVVLFQALVAQILIARRQVTGLLGHHFTQADPRKGISPPPGISKRMRRVYLLIFMLYAALGIITLLRSTHPVLSADTHDYMFMTGIPLRDWFQFTTSLRPWTVPLFYKLVASQQTVVPWMQTLLWVGCWTMLAYAFSISLRPGWLQVVSFTLLLIFSLSLPVVMWNRIILSESISSSLFVLLAGLWLLLLQKWKVGLLLAVIVVTFFWQNARETNIYLLIMLAGFLFRVDRGGRHKCRSYRETRPVILLTDSGCSAYHHR